MRARGYYFILMVLFSTTMAGCGAIQSVSNATANATKAVFIWEVNTLHLDFSSRSEVNLDDEFVPSAVVVRIYQLKEKERFASATYASLVNNDSDTLGDTLLEQKEFVLKPSSSVSVDVPLNKKAEYIGIIALFRDPDLTKNNWRLAINRDDLNIISPRKIDVNKYHLVLLDNK